jgi:hypothetical protein
MDCRFFYLSCCKPPWGNICFGIIDTFISIDQSKPFPIHGTPDHVKRVSETSRSNPIQHKNDWALA